MKFAKYIAYSRGLSLGNRVYARDWLCRQRSGSAFLVYIYARGANWRISEAGALAYRQNSPPAKSFSLFLEARGVVVYSPAPVFFINDLVLFAGAEAASRVLRVLLLLCAVALS